MKANKLVDIVVAALEEIKAYDIEVLGVTELTAMFDYVIIASADSTRQNKALSDNVQEKVKAGGGKVYSVEGAETGEWLLVDLGEVVVHIMLPAAREYYNLSALWMKQKY